MSSCTHPAGRAGGHQPLAFGGLILLWCLLGVASAAPSEREIVLPDGTMVPVTRYAAEGDRLLLWLPSEFGAAPERAPVARALAARGVEVWLPDLHAAWFLAPGRGSLAAIPAEAVAALVETARASGRRVWLLAPGRTVLPALRGLRHLQGSGRAEPGIVGLIALGPRLFSGRPREGEAVGPAPITGASNVPIHILQPRDAAGFLRLADTIRRLERGGAPVSWQILDGARDGFHVREDATAAELELRRRLPGMLLGAMRLLEPLGGLPPRAAPLPEPPRTRPSEPPEAEDADALLRPLRPPRPAPALRLPDLEGRPVDLASLRGKVVLVNFWATWCPPCVEELPALDRLHRALRDRGLRLLAVSVAEPRERVRAFLERHPVGFPVLLDERGAVMKRWRAHAFPTTFLIDRHGRIRRAGFGAFEWDGPEIRPLVEALLDEAPPESGAALSPAAPEGRSRSGRPVPADRDASGPAAPPRADADPRR